MHPARIAELLEPFLQGGNDVLYKNISTYIDILLRWNARINLTAIRDPEEIVTRHFGESLFAARHLFPSPPSVSSVVKGFEANDQRPRTNDDASVADLGSGAGFPGIPIKLWAPHIALTLIESNQKKVTFLREVFRALTLTDIDIFPGRAENMTDSHIASFDVVTLRAVERFHQALPIAARLLRPGGRLALLIGTSQIDQAHSTLPAFTWQPSVPVPLSNSRILLVGTSAQH